MSKSEFGLFFSISFHIRFWNLYSPYTQHTGDVHIGEQRQLIGCVMRE